MFKIRYKLLVVMLAVSLIPQIIINQISLTQIESQINERFNKDSKNSALSIQRYVTDILKTNEVNIKSLEKNIQYIYDQNLVINKDYMSQLVRIVQESSGATPNLYVGTADGDMIIYPDDQLPAGYDPRLRSWYQMANLNRDRVNWFGPYIDQGTKQLVITVSKYYNFKGKEGVIGIDIVLSNLSSELKSNLMGEQSEIFIVDELGEIILHSNPSFEGLNVKYTKYKDEGLQYAIKQGSYSGEKYSFVAMPIINNMSIVTVTSKEDIKNIVNDQMKNVRQIPLLFLVITGAIVIFFADRMTRPINRLMEAMQKAEKGEYQVKLNDRGNDELAQLTQQFNRMAESIRSNQEEMTALYEELSASEETLQEQYDELVNNRDQLAKSELRYRLIFDTSSEGLWEIDKDNGLNIFSPTWFKHYFLDIDTLKVDDWLALIQPEDRNIFVDGLENHINGLTPYMNVVYRVIDRKGQERIIQSRAKAARDQNGQLETIAGSHLDVTEKMSNEEKILKMAYFDEVTGFANRQNFERELEKYYQTHQWGRVIYIDITEFKHINEVYGYLIGDQVLKDLSNRLKNIFSDYFISRVSGDEFAVILPGFLDEEALENAILALNTESLCVVKHLQEEVCYNTIAVQCKFPNDGKNIETLMMSLFDKMKLKKALTKSRGE